jgi:hypothetical protein
MKEFEKLIMALYKNNYNLQRAPGTHWIGGWVGPRTGLDFVEKRNILPLPGIPYVLGQLRVVEKFHPP